MKFYLILITIFTSLTLSGCLSNDNSVSSSRKRSALLGQNSASTQPTGPRHLINQVNVMAGSSQNTQTLYDVQVYFNSAAPAITSSCAQATDCQCQFQWDDVNNTGGTPVAYKRTVRTGIKTLQAHLLICQAPDVYATEIADSSLITLQIIPSGAHIASFSTNGYSFRKKAQGSTGDFQDSEGRAFQNVFRYSCFDEFKKGTGITPERQTLTGIGTSGSGSATITFANQFCVANSSGSTIPTPQCPNVSTQNSSQSYYYNLYVRSSEVGVINSQNSSYRCPRVTSPLRGTSANYYPLDSTFALSLQPSVEFPVGVEANSRLDIPNDPTSVSTSCFGGSSTGSSGSGILKSCLGFGALPKVDGSCPLIGGQKTYRLRRYVVVYPPHYEADGKMRSGPQPTDTIYVLDRPVAVHSSETFATASATMLGPKPCPFAWYDKSKQGSLNAYISTNHSSWNGRNVDGISFPAGLNPNTGPQANQPFGANACSAIAPVWDFDPANALSGRWRLGRFLAGAPVAGSSPLISSLYQSQVRPVQAWAPHYIEDLEFRACAPLATPFVDAPLHAETRAQNNVERGGYCARAYPSHNTQTGQTLIADYTGTLPPATRPVRAPASTTNPWQYYPILASDAFITQGITDPNESYACTISFDTGQGFIGLRTPRSGCCGGGIQVNPQGQYYEGSITGTNCALPSL